MEDGAAMCRGNCRPTVFDLSVGSLDLDHGPNLAVVGDSVDHLLGIRLRDDRGTSAQPVPDGKVMSEAIYFLLDKLLIVSAIACLVIWARLLMRRRGQPSSLLESIVPIREQPRPCWSVADALVMFGTNLILVGLLHSWLTARGLGPASDVIEQPVPSNQAQLGNVAVVVIAGLGSAAVALLRIRLLDDQPLRRLGLEFNAGDAWLGLKASLMLLPPVLLISALVSLLWPYQHQVLDLLQSVDSAAVFLVMLIATAVVTPFVEELLFRVLLQGGLQGLIDRDESTESRWRPRSYLPIILASMIFALMHLGQGAAPIPLFFLSLGLGYLYRQTGNITAPLVVHMVLNGLTMIAKFTETAGSGA